MSDTLVQLWADVALHGKTINGSTRMGDTYVLDFTDGISLWMRARAAHPDSGHRLWIDTEMKGADEASPSPSPG